MKKLLLLISVCASAIGMYAEPITLQKAKSLAASYMKQADAPRLVKRKATLELDTESQPLYIFSRGGNQGYVMVSGDDRLPVILGYTESGDFDENDVPPALQDMIDYYSEAAIRLQSDAEMTQPLAAAPRRASSGTKDIPTLMTSHHKQDWPYNLLCPMGKDGSYRAVTGCVATAASQIIYYWRRDLDDRTKYGTPTYGYGDAPVTESIPSGTPLKWDLMYDSYSGSDPEESLNAIATLVACVGSSAWLTYGKSTSGQIGDCVNVFAGQFGLNGGTLTWRGGDQTAWEKLIIKDLEASHPILYAGVHPSNGGHAVVIDGYRVSDNLFHFNFGWGGNGDGYYTVDDAGMNGFSGSQGMVYGISPRKWNITGEIELESPNFVRSIANTIKVRVTNNSSLPQKGVYLYCLTGSSLPGSSNSNPQASDTKTEIAIGETAEFTFSFKPSSSDTYTIYLCGPDKTILAKVPNITAEASIPALTLNGLSSDDGGTSETIVVDGEEIEVKHIYNSKKTSIIANFTNGEGGTLCMPSIKSNLHILTDGAFVSKSSKTKSNVTFEPGATEDVVYDLTGLTDGAVYKFFLEGTANTDRTYNFDYGTPATALYFKLMGANLEGTKNEEGNEMTVTGNYNSMAFATLSADVNVSRYDMTQVSGMTNASLSAANPNALFYVDASAHVSGRNIIADGVTECLELTPGYNFEPKEDFHAMQAIYHATQAVGLYGTMYLPFDAPTPAGMFARKVNRLKGGYLQEVDSCNLELKSGTPYIILTGAPIDVTASDVNVSTQVPSEGTDSVRGTWTNIVATSTQYILDDAASQNFNASTGSVIPALTAYLEYTKKVAANSYEYSTKDKRARQLAEQIIAAWEAYNNYAATSPEDANAALLAAIAEADETLRTQPLATAQSAQIKTLEAAIEAYQIAQIKPAEDGTLDVSYLIQNPSFEAGSLKGWKQTSSAISRTTTNHAQYMSGADGTCLARVSKGGTIYQALTGLESGTYRMDVLVAADYDNHIDIFAGEMVQTIEATDFGPMYFKEASIDGIQVTDGQLTIGASAVEDWVKVDNFRLVRTGPADGIIEIPAAAHATKAVSQDGVYDLTGRRIADTTDGIRHLPKGIYIVNGKKVKR